MGFFRWRESLSDSPRKGGKGAKGPGSAAAPAEPAPGTRLVFFRCVGSPGMQPDLLFLRIETGWYRFKKKGPNTWDTWVKVSPDGQTFQDLTKWHGEFCFTFKASFRGEARGFKKFLLKFDDLWKNTTHCWILWCILRTNANNGTLSRHLITTCSRQKLTANAIV
jgi:hypothetical protein